MQAIFTKTLSKFSRPRERIRIRIRIRMRVIRRRLRALIGSPSPKSFRISTKA